MFWKLLGGVVRTTIAINRSVTALGLTVIIVVGVHDYLKQRKRREQIR